MKRLLQRMLDESEFLSDYGVRALSRAHLEQPYVFRLRRQRSHGALHARPNPKRGTSAAIPTGADRSGSRSIS